MVVWDFGMGHCLPYMYWHPHHMVDESRLPFHPLMYYSLHSLPHILVCKTHMVSKRGWREAKESGWSPKNYCKLDTEKGTTKLH